jgi:hypothetical protein
MLNRRAVILLLAMAMLCIAVRQSRAADYCPKHYTCAEVRLGKTIIGEDAMIARAKACGWSDAKIAEAMKCLK